MQFELMYPRLFLKCLYAEMSDTSLYISSLPFIEKDKLLEKLQVIE